MKLNPHQRRLRLQIIFAFMAIYALILFLRHPDPTRAQVIFRAVCVVIGVAGLAVVSARDPR